LATSFYPLFTFLSSSLDPVTAVLLIAWTPSLTWPTTPAANPIEIANLWLQQKFGLAIPTYETSRLLFLAFVFLWPAFNISNFTGRLFQLRHGDLFEKFR
jgi:hypothetical protein